MNPLDAEYEYRMRTGDYATKDQKIAEAKQILKDRKRKGKISNDDFNASMTWLESKDYGHGL